MKTRDHFWTDPPADELVQRHRISGSSAGATSPANRRPGLHVSSSQCDLFLKNLNWSSKSTV